MNVFRTLRPSASAFKRRQAARRAFLCGFLCALCGETSAAPVAAGPSAPPVVAIADYLQTNNTVAARRQMTETVLAAGAIPVVLPEMDDASADRILSFCDAVLIGGGVKMQDYDRRCAFEDRVIALAAKRGLRIVGICHGCQIVNRHFGGELGFVPEERKLVHKDAEYRERTGRMVEHFATVLPGGSLMSRVFGEGRLKVNSSHKYRCTAVAPGFRVTALSEDDGVIEAIQHETLPIYGFQFHPECYWGDNPKFLELMREALGNDANCN